MGLDHAHAEQEASQLPGAAVRDRHPNRTGWPAGGTR